MYVNATHFDYDAFLGGIIEHAGLKDTGVTDDAIKDILLKFEVAYRQHMELKDKLTPIQKEICHRFIVSVLCDVYCEDESSEYAVTDMSKLTEVMDKRLAYSLDSLEALLTSDIEPLDIDEVTFFLNWMSERGKEVNKGDYCFEIEGMGYINPADFVNHLSTWLESYVRSSFSELNKFIFDNINWNILPREILIGLTILDRPGKTVKYGNALITFPIILLEVFPNG